MVDIVLKEKTPLNGVEFQENGCALREVTDVGLTSLAVPLGGEDAFAKMLVNRFKLERPSSRISTTNGTYRAVSLTADQVLLMHPASEVFTDVTGAYSTDQTSNWCVLELIGKNSHEILSRVCPIDIHDAAFSLNASARTVMEHIGVLIIKPKPNEFLLLSTSSFGQSIFESIRLSIINASFVKDGVSN